MAVIICFFHPLDHRLGPVRGCPLCIGIRNLELEANAISAELLQRERPEGSGLAEGTD